MFLVLVDHALRWDDDGGEDLARTWWLHPDEVTFRGHGHVAMAAPHDEMEFTRRHPLWAVQERSRLYSIPR